MYPQPVCTLSPLESRLFEAGGFSYNPATQTAAEGRTECAIYRAAALAWADAAGVRFDWRKDPDIDSSDFSGKRPAWRLWECIAFDEAGDVLACMGAVDFGRDGTPWRDDYARTVEADLAADAYAAFR